MVRLRKALVRVLIKTQTSEPWLTKNVYEKFIGNQHPSSLRSEMLILILSSFVTENVLLTAVHYVEIPVM